MVFKAALRRSYVLTMVSKTCLWRHGLANRTIAPLPLAERPLQACYRALTLVDCNVWNVCPVHGEEWRSKKEYTYTYVHRMQCNQIISSLKHSPNTPDAFVSYDLWLIVLQHVCSNANIHTLSQKLWAVLTGPGPCMPCSQHAAVPLWCVAALIIGLSLKLGQRPSQQIVASF